MQTGQKIAFLRKKSGLSQDELAERLFVSRELVSKWENGKRNPDYKMLAAISAVFGVSSDDIFDVNCKVFDELRLCFPKNTEFSQKQINDILNLFLKELSQIERTIFISRYYYGQSSDETAALLGLRGGYVRKKLTVIRKKLTEFAKEDIDAKF